MARRSSVAAAKSTDEVNLERAAEALWNAEFLIVAAGPLFEEGRSPFTSEFCDPSLVAKPNKFMGFWGAFFNEFSDRSPHDGYHVLCKWRDKLYCLEDIRKRKKGKQAEEDQSELDRIPRLGVYTSNIGNMFQKAGLPHEEVFEACGNITTWQCSRNPVCCNKTWTVDRQFRFVIDEQNDEALPIKYVPDRREKKQNEVFITVDSDDEELLAMKGDDAPVTDPRFQRDAIKRAQRRLERGAVNPIRHNFQIGRERFPDSFTGFATTRPGSIQTTAFPKPPTPEPSHHSDEDQPVSPSATGYDINPAGGEPAAPATPEPETPCNAPPRTSHLLAHVNAIDRNAFHGKAGRLFVCEPERWLKDREQQYQAQSKFFQAEAPTVASQRAKFISYNISMILTEPKDGEVDPHANPLGNRRFALPEHLRERLFAVHRATDTVPVLDSTGVPTGAVEPPMAQAERMLQQEELEPWTQGRYGRYYFSHVKSSKTTQEPLNHRYQDVIEIQFPRGEDGKGVYLLPKAGGMISLVCETVVDETKMPEGAKLNPEDNRFSYCRNVWQLVGTTITPDFSDTIEFKGKDTIEYVLESRKRHVVRIGAHKDAPDRINYIIVEAPADEADEKPGFVTHVRTSVDQMAALRSNEQNLRDRLNKDDKANQRRPMPTPNHQLCVHCHDVARPFILMSRPGLKDDGFASSVLMSRTKQYKSWEKMMMECLKQDTNKSLVILELGCDKKMDQARNYSEKTFKQLKAAKCTFVRISPNDLESKKKSAAQEAPNYIPIQANIIHSLNVLDRMLSEKMRKKGN